MLTYIHKLILCEKIYSNQIMNNWKFTENITVIISTTISHENFPRILRIPWSLLGLLMVP